MTSIFFFFLIFYYYYFLLLKFYLALAFFAACDITSVIHSVLVLSTYYDIKSQEFFWIFSSTAYHYMDVQGVASMVHADCISYQPHLPKMPQTRKKLREREFFQKIRLPRFSIVTSYRKNNPTTRPKKQSENENFSKKSDFLDFQ